MLLELAIADAYGAGFEYSGLEFENCIAFTGDVDTVAAIALGAASCSPEYQQDIPQHLIENLENVEYGQDYLMNLDHKLMSLVSNIFSLKNPDVVFGDRGNVVFEIIF